MTGSTTRLLLAGLAAGCCAEIVQAQTATATLAPTSGNTAGGTATFVAEHHAGDLPMLHADASGNAALDAAIEVITVGSGVTDIVGRSVILHKDADDYRTQPTGNSGARVACGIIKKS